MEAPLLVCGRQVGAPEHAPWEEVPAAEQEPWEEEEGLRCVWEQWEEASRCEEAPESETEP